MAILCDVAHRPQTSMLARLQLRCRGGFHFYIRELKNLINIHNFQDCPGESVGLTICLCVAFFSLGEGKHMNKIPENLRPGQSRYRPEIIPGQSCQQVVYVFPRLLVCFFRPFHTQRQVRPPNDSAGQS